MYIPKYLLVKWIDSRKKEKELTLAQFRDSKPIEIWSVGIGEVFEDRIVLAQCA